LNLGFDAITINPISRLVDSLNDSRSKLSMIIYKFWKRFLKIKKITVVEYKNAVNLLVNKNEDSLENVIPTIIANWDHSPRSSKNAWLLHNSTPELFERNVNSALECLKDKPTEKRLLFLKSWNEWGEGNYIEPDLVIGNGYLEILRNKLT
jgi:hypothetical protein